MEGGCHRRFAFIGYYQQRYAFHETGDDRGHSRPNSEDRGSVDELDRKDTQRVRIPQHPDGVDQGEKCNQPEEGSPQPGCPRGREYATFLPAGMSTVASAVQPQRAAQFGDAVYLVQSAEEL